MLVDMAKAAKLANMPIERLNEYEKNMRTELDRLSEINTAKRIGREEGKADIARKLLSDGVSAKKVAEYTDLSEEQVLALK